VTIRSAPELPFTESFPPASRRSFPGPPLMQSSPAGLVARRSAGGVDTVAERFRGVGSARRRAGDAGGL
jgi:hypothetical protein